MAQSLPYSIPYSQQCLVQSHSHPSAAYNLPNHHIHLLPPQMRPDQAQRKRPKYTRSKTGCLTCRGKKIKCDETKPKCQRCAHGQRECTWPDPTPSKKKAPVRRSSTIQEPPSASNSPSNLSDVSSTSRDVTPNRKDTVDKGTVSSTDRRYSEPQVNTYPVTGPQTGRRQTLPALEFSQMHPQSLPSAYSTNAVSNFPNGYHSSVSSSYSVAHSSGGSVSSRSNSRPSTANSLPPVRLSTFDTPPQYSNPVTLPQIDSRGTYIQHIDNRDTYAQARWDIPPRTETNGYTYHAGQHDSDVISRHYSHEHNNRLG